jgi:hypothetical protein
VQKSVEASMDLSGCAEIHGGIHRFEWLCRICGGIGLDVFSLQKCNISVQEVGGVRCKGRSGVRRNGQGSIKLAIFSLTVATFTDFNIYGGIHRFEWLCKIYGGIHKFEWLCRIYGGIHRFARLQHLWRHPWI